MTPVRRSPPLTSPSTSTALAPDSEKKTRSRPAGVSATRRAASSAAGALVGMPGPNTRANAVSVAEHTMLLILSTMKKLAGLHEGCMAGKWRVGDFSQNRLFELEGKTALITGGVDAAARCADSIRRAVLNDKISARRIDEAVARVVALKTWAGAFDG